MRWQGRAVVVGLVLVTAVAGGAPTALAGVAPMAGAGPPAASAVSASAQSQPTTDSTVTRIAVAENGSAAWVVQVRTRLDSQADVENYEAFQDGFRANRSRYLDPFRERMRGVVADAAEATGRPMRARGFRANTSIQTIPRRWGLVTYEFRWSAFAARDGEAVVVGDVFGGRFFLTENDTLEVTGPAGYAPGRVAPEPDERDPRTVRWFGQRAFADERPFVRFVPASTPTNSGGSGADTTGPDGTTGARPTESGPRTTGRPGGTDPGESRLTTARTTDGSGTVGSGLWPFVVVLVAGLLAVGTVGYWRASRRHEPGDGNTGEDATQVSHGSGGSAAGGADGATAPESDIGGTASGPDGGGSGPSGDGETARKGSGEDEAGASEPTAGGTGAAAGAVDPSPVVTDEERVRDLLEEHDGQLKQGDIVAAFDWSKSKTSRVLSNMAEEGTVEKLRIGRENVIRLQSDDEGSGIE